MDTRFGSMLAGSAVLALALAWSPAADAQECDSSTGCLTAALTGLVKGFAGQAGAQLWGWMLGGSASAGTDAIASELATIEATLQVIEDELGPNGPIVEQLRRLQCADDSDWIAAGPATDIGSWYARYQNFLTELQGGATIAVGDISSQNTDVTTLYGWANGVIQGNANVAPNDVFTAMISLDNLAVENSSSGTISDCIQASGNEPASGTIDDRPYYGDNVQTIQNYLLNLNTQAMIVLVEAYHIYAYGECVTANGVDACTRNDSSDVIPLLCPPTSTSPNCLAPVTIYGQLGSRPSGQFLPFVHAQFEAGGAPYSTDEYLTVNGQDYLIARSIEQYNKVLDPGNALHCSTTEPGKLTSAPGDVCGASVGLYNDTLFSFDFGPYNYGRQTTGGGTWVSAPYTLFLEFLKPFNSSAPGSLALTDFLCTMSISGGDASNCTQPNGGAGLFFGKKIVIHPETDFNSWIQTYIGSDQLIFTDGGLQRQYTNQPISAREDLLGSSNDQLCFPLTYIFHKQHSWSTEQVDPRWYEGKICLPPNDHNGPPEGWMEPGPGYNPPDTYPQYQWAALDWTKLPCSNGEAANDPSNLNPAGVPALCGADFETWFDALVPPGPSTTTAIADTTISRSAPNANDGGGSTIDVRGRQALIAFDQDQIQAFLDAGPLASAQLVLSSADRSTSGGRIDLVALPLRAGFVEGNGDAAEHDPGTGTGATWNCAEDAEIGDDLESCLQDWPQPRTGGRWQSAPRVSVQDGHAGPVSFDVTEHVAGGTSGWLIHRERGSGSFRFHSREGAELLADPSLAPTLILHRALEEKVVAAAD